MKKMIVESWLTTILGVLIGLFGFATLWYGKTTLWETIPIWVIGVIFIFADEAAISGLINKLIGKNKAA